MSNYVKNVSIVGNSSSELRPGAVVYSGSDMSLYQDPDNLSFDDITKTLHAKKITVDAVPASDLQVATKSYVDLASNLATVTLTAANIAAMNGTPVTVLAAPGAGKSIVIDQVIFRFNWVGVQYTGGGAVSIQYNTASTNVLGGTLAAAFITGPTAAVTTDKVIGGLTTGLDVLQNKALEITNGTAAFATGDSTLTLYIRYRIVG